MLARSDDSSADSDVTETLQRVLRFAEGGLSGAAVSVDGRRGVRARIPEARLGQVLVNLLANASFAVTDLPGAKIGIRVFEEGTRVVVEITDNGVGIAPENMARIFDPFFTTRPDGVGTGLGLWLVRRILDAHGATIACESRSGEGTTFRVSIPAAAVD
jgi:signal transduction histidine kinase